MTGRQHFGRASVLRVSLLAGVALVLALPSAAGAASGSATITSVTYAPSQPSAPASCMVPPGLSGSGSESYTTPDTVSETDKRPIRTTTWEWTVPATLTAGATADIKVTSTSNNNGGSSDAIGMSTPQEFGATPSMPSQVIATVPVGAPGTNSAEQSYTFNPTRDFVTGETFVVRISFGCANFDYTYTGHAAPSGCGTFADRLSAHASFSCPVPLPLTPNTTPPKPGIRTSYAAPQTFTQPVRLPGVAIRPTDVSATLDIGMSRDNGTQLNDTDLLAGISDNNIARGARVCWVLLEHAGFAKNKTKEEMLLRQALVDEFRVCVLVVAQILQRAEKLHQKPPVAIDATAACPSGFARLKGARHAPRVRLTCARTSTGVRITIRSTNRKRKLRSLIGPSPSLIIGRLRSTDPIQAGDRVNVRWTTSTR